MAGLSVDDVLEDLDNAADGAGFPDFGNPNCDYFGFRLEVYRSVDDYAIVFNTITYRQEGIRANIDPFGGEIGAPGIIGTGDIDVDYPDDDTEIVRGITVRGRAIPPGSLVYSQPDQPDRRALRAMVALIESPLCEALFATHAEVQQSFSRGMPPRFLTLDSWRHIENERPSENETFQSLAKAIAGNDASLYKPSAKPNTHWACWYERK